MQYIRDKLQLFRSYLPAALPQNGAELNARIAEILFRANLPDNDSFKQALAGEFMQPANLEKNRSVQHYVRILKQRVTSQLAYVIIDGIRNKEKEAAASELLQNQSIS